MSRNSKSKDYKLNKNLDLEKEFLRCYQALKHYDAECTRLNEEADRGDMNWSVAQNMIDECEQLQRNIILHMMAINVDLKYKDKAMDAYLRHLVYIFGL